jgi:hypothetical protein
MMAAVVVVEEEEETRNLRTKIRRMVLRKGEEDTPRRLFYVLAKVQVFRTLRFLEVQKVIYVIW